MFGVASIPGQRPITSIAATGLLSSPLTASSSLGANSNPPDPSPVPTEKFGSQNSHPTSATDSTKTSGPNTFRQPDRSKSIEFDEALWIQGIIDQILNTENAKGYDWDLIKVPNGRYHKDDELEIAVLESPMNLFKMRIKLGGLFRKSEYENIEAVIRDFDLIVQDTIDRAGSEAQMTERARKMRTDFMEQLDAGYPVVPPTEASKKRPHPDSELPSGSTTVDGQPSATKQKTSNT